MAFFPFFFEVGILKGLVIGGGKIALEKVSRLSEYGADLIVIAPEILPEIREYKNTKCILKTFAPEDLSGADYCIAATGDETVNRKIYECCKERHISVNVVDDRDKCDFIFPSVARKGDMIVGVTSSGKSPQVAIELRKRIEEIIPENTEEILDYLGSIREDIKSRVPDVKRRHKIFKQAAADAMEKGRPLNDEELEIILISVTAV